MFSGGACLFDLALSISPMLHAESKLTLNISFFLLFHRISSLKNSQTWSDQSGLLAYKTSIFNYFSRVVKIL